MKILVLLSVALLVAGCGEKSSSEGSDSTGESAEASLEAAQQSEEPLTLPLSDADVERLLKEAVDMESLKKRGRLLYQSNELYSGWAKILYHSGQVRWLSLFKDGERIGPSTQWHENGQKESEVTYKDGKPDGLWTSWHENGQKMSESHHKDNQLNGPYKRWHENGQKMGEQVWKGFELVSEKWWNSKGEEVETQAEAFK